MRARVVKNSPVQTSFIPKKGIGLRVPHVSTKCDRFSPRFQNKKYEADSVDFVITPNFNSGRTGVRAVFCFTVCTFNALYFACSKNTGPQTVSI